MAGMLTNGLPLVGAQIQNGTAQSAPKGVVTQGDANSLLPMDTELANGENPASVAVTLAQAALISAKIAANTATSTAGAATLNTQAGTVTTESLSTAAGATYSFTLTNSLITTASAPPYVGFYSKTNTGGQVTVQSVTVGAGSAVIVIENSGTTAFNGTFVLAFHVQGAYGSAT